MYRTTYLCYAISTPVNNVDQVKGYRFAKSSQLTLPHFVSRSLRPKFVLRSSHADLEELVGCYNSILSRLLDLHAPVLTKTVIKRRCVPDHAEQLSASGALLKVRNTCSPSRQQEIKPITSCHRLAWSTFLTLYTRTAATKLNCFTVSRTYSVSQVTYHFHLTYALKLWLTNLGISLNRKLTKSTHHCKRLRLLCHLLLLLQTVTRLSHKPLGPHLASLQFSQLYNINLLTSSHYLLSRYKS